MTLKQLEAFYWAATCANFAMAAERLHLSTSSLSKRLVELEESVGVRLFDRSGHKAMLTEAGERFLPHVGALLLSAEETRRAIGEASGLASRCLLGVCELSALTWLPRLIAHVRLHHPELRLEPRVDAGQILHERLCNGELDCAVVVGRAFHPSIASHTVAQMQFVWAAAPSLVRRSSSLREALLEQHPVVTLPPGAGAMEILDEWLVSKNLDAPHRLTCNSWGAIAGLLIDGMGIGFLPEVWARALARRGELRVLKAQPALSPLTCTLQRRRNDDRSFQAAIQAAVLASADFRAPPRLV